MTKYPKHESKVGESGRRRREQSPFVATPLPAVVCGWEQFFPPKSLERRTSPFLWGSSEGGVESSFWSEGSPVVKRASHSPWVGSEQRAATVWKQCAKKFSLESVGQVATSSAAGRGRGSCAGVPTLCKGGGAGLPGGEPQIRTRLCLHWDVDRWRGQRGSHGHPCRFTAE